MKQQASRPDLLQRRAAVLLAAAAAAGLLLFAAACATQAAAGVRWSSALLLLQLGLCAGAALTVVCCIAVAEAAAGSCCGPTSDADTPAAVPPPAVAAVSSAGPADVDVWVLAGQSNCVGFNQPDGQPMPDAAAPWPGRILAYDAHGGGWKDAAPNVHLHVCGYEDADSCGPDMAFARMLLQAGAAPRVGLVPTACGGTNLYEQWAPGGQLWSNMVASTRGALDSLGPRGRLAGILWVQGESDALAMQPAFAYGVNFTHWLAATREALSRYHREVPVLLVVMAERGRRGAFPFIDVVAASQRALQLPALHKLEMAGFELFAAPGDPTCQLIHLTKAGACALGTALAYEVLAAAKR